MTFHQPLAMQPASGDPSVTNTALEFRNLLSALMATGPGFQLALTSGGGVSDTGSGATFDGSLVVSQHAAGANFSVDVSAGYCFVNGTDLTNQGLYGVWNDGVVNVATPSAPASGTRVHRLIIQVQDKFSNGVWTGYQAVPVILQDTGSGTPVAGNSAITLALISISAGQASVLNANITDYRRAMGTLVAYKASNTGITSSTALADDPDLQLWGLQANQKYNVQAMIFYKGANGSSDLKWTFRCSSGAGGQYLPQHWNVAGNLAFAVNNWTDTVNAQTTGTSNTMVATFNGTFATGGTAPNNYLVMQWAQNTSNGTATTVEGNSFLRAVPIG